MKLTEELRAALRVMQSEGGKARAKKLTKARRVAIAKMGAKARWPNGKKTT